MQHKSKAANIDVRNAVMLNGESKREGNGKLIKSADYFKVKMIKCEAHE